MATLDIRVQEVELQGSEVIRTLSKREIFMAFMVAESTRIGGPSSNTSLMNSLPWRHTPVKGDAGLHCVAEQSQGEASPAGGSSSQSPRTP